MPFDGTDFQPRRGRGNRAKSGDNMVSVIIILIAVALLATPFTLSGLVDIVSYIRGGR